MKRLIVILLLVIGAIMLVSCKPTPTPTPPTLTPTVVPIPLHKDVVVTRDPKASAFEWDKISTVNDRPVFVYATNPGTDNRLYYLLGDVLNVHLTHDTFPVNDDGAVQDKYGYWYYCVANGAFPNGLSAAGYYVRVDHVKDK